MSGEYKEINEAFSEGEVYHFTLDQLVNTNDTSLNLLVDHIKHLDRTIDSIANLNKIDLDEFDNSEDE